MEKQLAELVAERNNQWVLTNDKKAMLKAAFVKEKKFNFVIIPVPGSPGATAYSYAVMHVAGEAGWNSAVLPFDAFNSPAQTGLRVAVRLDVKDKGNEAATRLRSIFEELTGLKMGRFVHHPGIQTDTAAALIVGTRPQ